MANQKPPTAAGVAGMKRAASAVADVNKKRPDLAKQLVNDLLAAGFVYDSSCQTDVNNIAANGYTSDARTIDTELRNPAVLYAIQYDFYHQIAGGLSQALNPALSQVGETIPKTAAAAGKGITDFAQTPLGPLFQANLWIRVGEVAIGLILIAVGVAKLTNAVPIATKIAKVVK